MKQDIHRKIDEFIDSNKNDMISDLQEFIRIPSVKTDPEKEAPFGDGCKKSLEWVLNKSEELLSLKTTNMQNYVGFVDYGEGEPALGILSHIDVVPIGEGWTKEAFSGEIIDERIYGRGTQDDKGPTLSALYALAAVKNSGVKLNKRVRFIFGADEESGWEDIDHYKKTEIMPEFGFSPDSRYPVGNVEKGILAIKIEESFEDLGSELYVESLKAGERRNVVPGRAKAMLAGNIDSFIQDIKSVSNDISAKTSCNFIINKVEDKLSIIAEGEGGHASSPWESKNALCALLALLNSIELSKNDSQLFIDRLAKAFPHDSYHGEAAKIYVEDQLSGKITACLSIIDLDENNATAFVDSRLPISSNPDMIIKIFSKENKLNASIDGLSPAHYVPESSELVQKLLKVYNEETGEEAKPFASGGGTYARALAQGVSFGGIFPEEEEFFHQADESCNIDNYIKNAKIIAKAIVELCS